MDSPHGSVSLEVVNFASMRLHTLKVVVAATFSTRCCLESALLDLQVRRHCQPGERQVH